MLGDRIDDRAPQQEPRDEPLERSRSTAYGECVTTSRPLAIRAATTGLVSTLQVDSRRRRRSTARASHSGVPSMSSGAAASV